MPSKRLPKLTKEDIAAIKPGEWRSDSRGLMRCMAVVENYVMVRRVGCMPFVVSVRDWLDMPMHVAGNTRGNPVGQPRGND